MKRREFLGGLAALTMANPVELLGSLQQGETSVLPIVDNEYFSLQAYSAGFKRGDLVFLELQPKLEATSIELEASMKTHLGTTKEFSLPITDQLFGPRYAVTGIDFQYPAQELALDVSYIPNNRFPYTGDISEVIDTPYRETHSIPIRDRSFASDYFTSKKFSNATPMSAEDRAEVVREQRELYPSWKGTNNDAYLLSGFTKPRPEYNWSRFGRRRFWDGVERSPHKGLDSPGNVGDPVICPLDGRVVLEGNYFFYMGNTAVIDHGLGMFGLFAHLEKQYVQVGDYVRKGDVIGEVGSSGRASGPHLHWQLKLQGLNMQPASLEAINKMI